MTDTPTTPPKMLVEDPKLMLKRLREFIGKCTKMLDDGHNPDLSNLDSQVAELCDGLQEMEVSEYTKIKPQLDTLANELEVLSQSLEQKRDSLGEELSGLSQQQKANNAYQKATSNMPPLPKKEEDS